MDSNNLLLVLSAVLGLVTLYLRHYTHSELGRVSMELTTEFQEHLRTELRDLRVELKEIRAELNARMDLLWGEPAVRENIVARLLAIEEAMTRLAERGRSAGAD
jgi:hypothetical protein